MFSQSRLKIRNASLEAEVKELRESLQEKITLKNFYKNLAEEAESEVNRAEYRHRANEMRWAEKLTSYEEKLKHRDLTIQRLEEELEKASEGSVAMRHDLQLVENAYDNLNELLKTTNKSLGECGERLWELEEENQRLRDELKKASQHPSLKVSVSVDVDTVAEKVMESVKKPVTKRYSCSFRDVNMASNNILGLVRQIDNEFNLSLPAYKALHLRLKGLDDACQHSDSISGLYSGYSNKLHDRVNVLLKVSKEGI